MSIVRDPVLAPSETGPGQQPAQIPGSRPLTRRRPLVVGVAIVLLAMLAGWMVYSRAKALDDLYAAQVVQFEDATGIRVVRVVVTAGGGIVELHYQVLDPDKAVAVHDEEAPPGLIDEKTGAIVAVPFHDHSFRELHTAVTYREMFMNGGGLLQRGSKVTFTVGDSIIEHIEVG